MTAPAPSCAPDDAEYDPKEVGFLLMSALGHLENCMANDRIGGVGSLVIRRALSVADRELSRLRLLAAPSCAPGEVERLRASISLMVLDAIHQYDNRDGWTAQDLATDATASILAALSPQGLDAKEGGE